MRHIGLHLRLTESLHELAQKAQNLRLPFFQCFFVFQATGKLIMLSEKEIQSFVKKYRDVFSGMYLHGSYWINLAGIKNNGYRAFKRELALAKRLSFTHMILHSGSATGAENRIEGINAFASMLNSILKDENEIQIIVENTAHGNMAIGSDIHDFKLLLERLEQPHKIAFSIDTAHAYVYGYDLATEQGQEDFIELIDTSIGVDKVKLIHLNDASYKCGSKIDRHAIIGKGYIGSTMLRRFILHPQLQHIPLILELPVIPEEQEIAILEMVRSWH
ncbi:MAG: deoxyribonuclease IV [bacterium]|nr:deoxyribonuclease IV [bacterium]